MSIYVFFFQDHDQADQHYFPIFAFLFMMFTFHFGLRSLPSLLLYLNSLFIQICKACNNPALLNLTTKPNISISFVSDTKELGQVL